MIREHFDENVWLDIEQLDSTDDSGMFGQMAQGLKNCEVVVICISKQYTDSKNCQMEAEFALRTLHKPVVVLEVGTGDDESGAAWMSSKIGMLIATSEIKKYDVWSADSDEGLKAMLEAVCEEAIRPILGKKKEVAVKKEVNVAATVR